MKPRLSLLALFLALCLSVFAGETPKTVLKLVVKNQFGKPVENAEVILDFLTARQVTRMGLKKKIHWEVHTNQEGLAHFPAVPEGSIQLQINKKNYQTYGNKIDLAGEEQTVSVTLEPPQSQYSAHPAMKPAEAPKN